MKTQALMIAIALAAGSAFAAAPSESAKVDAAATPAAADSATPAPVKKSHKKETKKKHAATNVGMHHSGTHSMGAGAASPVTDLQGASRQSRIDEAYASWQAKQH